LDTQQDHAAPVDNDQLEAFITRWGDGGGTERANYQLFLTELCAMLGLPQPDPAGDDTEQNSYVFERRVDIHKPDGTSTRGYIDLYKRDCFVLEAKQTGKALDTDGWDKAMLKAQNQADQYVRALPAGEGRPPFIVVTDVGRSLELYAEFSQSGGTYVPFPDPGHHRIQLTDLRRHEIQERLRRLWTKPESLDPSKHAARVTRAVSSRLAELAKSLEQDGYEVERVAHFLKRCLFTMFSEDVGLLPPGSFTQLLEMQRKNSEHFTDALRALWESMNTGGYSPLLNTKIRQFNGGLFRGVDPIPLNSDQIELLWEAAKADWRYVEPAIFGTLLERALDPRERHKLGAHYTPREYVERLVMPTLIDPLREQWQTTQVATETWLQQGKHDKALAELRDFHHQLCETRVLDPACGSGNFLYVALEHMKRLEGEVLNLISDLSAGQTSFETEGLTVDPHQFLGLEINPRAAAIAEIVLWIGYLQWHHRIHGKLDIPDPVLRDFRNIQHKDALIEYDSREPELDENGDPVTIWDGIAMKTSSTTGELIPDETSRSVVYRYHCPRLTRWPEADYIVGNPPFIGNKRLRIALGDGYVDALRAVYKGEVPESADFVMYWWNTAADKVRHGQAHRFGFITTNSLQQTFNRRVLEPHLQDKKSPLSLSFAVPDHPWVDGNDGAAVRIAMTVGVAGVAQGELCQVISEVGDADGSRSVQLDRRSGRIFADLGIGADISGAQALKSNCLVSNRGMIPHGEGFLVTRKQGEMLDGGALIRPYRNGRDFTSIPRGIYVLDTFDLDEKKLKADYPETWQWLFDRVKPERDENKRKSVRDRWWRFAEPRKVLRAAHEGLEKYIATAYVSKHMILTFMDSTIVPDDGLVAIATNDPFWLGILSSRIHSAWALKAGGRLGMGNDPRYNKSRCFETFPFPSIETNPEETYRIRQISERIDLLRKQRQEAYPTLTLTDIYNVLEKIRANKDLTEKERSTHKNGLLSLLRDLHDELDSAVFKIYGWEDLSEKLVGRPGATTPLPSKPADQVEAEEELLVRLVELNKERAKEEANGVVRWLRPEYQAPDAKQLDANLPTAAAAASHTNLSGGTGTTGKKAWPKSLREQIEAVRSQLAFAPQTTQAIAAIYKRRPMKSVDQVLSALDGLGHVHKHNETWYLNQ